MPKRRLCTLVDVDLPPFPDSFLAAFLDGKLSAILRARDEQPAKMQKVEEAHEEEEEDVPRGSPKVVSMESESEDEFVFQSETESET